MCPYKSIFIEVTSHARSLAGTRTMYSRLIFILFFTILIVNISAEVQTEDYLMVKNWDLPEDAVLLSELHTQDNLLYQNDVPFSGWTYELYPEGSLQRAVEYKTGLQNGLNLLWYPDGSPQMSANYRNGVLHGRFVGWYLNGKVIYDMFINRGTYASDNLESRDNLRQEEVEIYEREGNTDDSTGE
ncbi:MAG: hypothetical protein PHQ78_03140 [Candidatus Cloacimonetes bacterium]|nr:hypothetical protein [Candidatus Cloacimonadota bacterium]MDD2506293.1 hypothetical protein [Candidatus Cloacimonadota bacterium]MDD4559887.1 hypothetical protein [Candidatus Cloacimonadota bacterium]